MDQEIADYFKILCPNSPAFLQEYAQVKEMQRLKGVGLFCGTDYSKLYHHRYFYSRYLHSYGAALIIWNFTKSKKQTLAGLFHDIATPVLSHCVDFLNGDSETQTSTEAKTHKIIAASVPICNMLDADQISISEIDDYHKYPIADNDTPQLSADRLEYTLSTMLVWHGGWNLGDIQEIYDDIRILIDEDGQEELGFLNMEIAEKFVIGACTNGLCFQRNENKLSMNYLGDLLGLVIDKQVIAEAELYILTEQELIRRFEQSKDIVIKNAWKEYRSLSRVYGSDVKPEEGYFVKINAKIRYIDPLVKTGENDGIRVSKLLDSARVRVEELLAYKDKKYGYILVDPFGG